MTGEARERKMVKRYGDIQAKSNERKVVERAKVHEFDLIVQRPELRPSFPRSICGSLRNIEISVSIYYLAPKRKTIYNLHYVPIEHFTIMWFSFAPFDSRSALVNL